jgi:MFS family permease
MGVFKGTIGLVLAAAVVVALLVAFPAYRWFFLISLGIGLAVWGVLYFWHRFHPIEAKDVQDTKRPLGLS